MENERKDIRMLSQRYAKLQTLINYVNTETLKDEHRKQLRNKATGIDKVTKDKYSLKLDENVSKLINRMKSFSYRPKPVRRTYIPKGNGKLRPLGIPSYEDKLVQGAMAKVLNEIYEPRFLDCSYGFREKRSCHDAIKVINSTIMTKKVGYILDCDIKGFFDNVNQEWLIEFLENDIEDKNFIRYIVRFLKSGIMEDGKYLESDKGTPQGGLISPILANVYLHYVLDLWFIKAIKPRLKGEAYLVRYADDFIIMFQHEHEAKRVYEVLKLRMAKFGLELAEDKTRILPFGRFTGTKETFDFLGFEHSNRRTQKGKYILGHKISKKKKRLKIESIKKWLRDHITTPLSELLKKLAIKLNGMYRYYGLSRMAKELHKLYNYAHLATYKLMNRRSQRKSFEYENFLRIWRLYVRCPKIYVNLWENI